MNCSYSAQARQASAKQHTNKLYKKTIYSSWLTLWHKKKYIYLKTIINVRETTHTQHYMPFYMKTHINKKSYIKCSCMIHSYKIVEYEMNISYVDISQYKNLIHRHFLWVYHFFFSRGGFIGGKVPP